MAGRRRDHRHAARSRREHRTLARARPRPGISSSVSASSTGVPARPRHLRELALRPHARRCLPVGLERGRYGHTGGGDRRARPRGRRARVGRRGALRAPRGDHRVHELGGDVLLCSPYKFFGPHLGLACVRPDLLEGWRPYKVRPQQRPRRRAARDRHAPARVAVRLRRGARLPRTRSAGASSPRMSASSASASSTACPPAGGCTAPRRWRRACPTFSLSPPDERPAEAAARLAEAAGLRSGTATTTRSR